jgi:hypothetical protein
MAALQTSIKCPHVSWFSPFAGLAGLVVIVAFCYNRLTGKRAKPANLTKLGE